MCYWNASNLCLYIIWPTLIELAWLCLLIQFTLNKIRVMTWLTLRFMNSSMKWIWGLISFPAIYRSYKMRTSVIVNVSNPCLLATMWTCASLWYAVTPKCLIADHIPPSPVTLYWQRVKQPLLKNINFNKGSFVPVGVRTPILPVVERAP